MIHFGNNGILNTVEGSLITYGGVYHSIEEKYRGYITTWEADLSAVSKSVVFELAEVPTAVYELHQWDSTLLIFTSFDHKPKADYYFIHELHDDALKLAYSYTDIASADPTLLVDRDGDYYFGSWKHPEMIWPPSTGRLNKFSKATGTLDWSLQLPSSPNDFRSYYVKDIIETEAGNIVACGTIEDTDERGSATTGFVVSVTSTGLMNWLRVYKFPNFISPDLLGAYRHSSLSKIKEDSHGNLIGFGYSFTFSSDGIPERELWILGLDQDGCLTPDSCEEINIVTSQHNVESQDDIVAYPNPVQDKLYFKNVEEYDFSIWDTNMTLVKTGKGKGSISFNDLPAALYIVRIDAKNSTPKFLIIIKI